MLSLLASLRGHKDLLYMLTWRDIKIKYKQSVMGFLWALLMPTLIVAAGVVVRVGLSSVSGKPLAATQVMTVALKALPWSFFVAALRFSTVSLAANARLVTRIAFPRAVLPISAVLSQLFDAVVASPVVVLILAFGSVGISWTVAWAPLLLAVLFVQAVGLALVLSAANLFFRDVKYIVEVFLTFAIFFTPVFYDADMFGRWAPLLMVNPVSSVLEGLRSCVVAHRPPDPAWTGYGAAIALLLAWAGPVIFLRLEPRFAESV